MKFALPLIDRVRIPKLVLRLRAKIFTIAALTLISMAAIGGIYAYQSMQIANAVASERDATTTLARIVSAASISEALRSDINGLALSPSNSMMERIRSDLDRLSQYVDQHPEEQELNGIAVELDATIGQEQHKPCPVIADVPQCLSKGRLRRGTGAMVLVKALNRV